MKETSPNRLDLVESNSIMSSVSHPHQQQRTSQRAMLAKKVRFIKRLKNCIETKRGNRFNYLQQIPYLEDDWYKRAENELVQSRPKITNHEHKSSMSEMLNTDGLQLDASIEPAYF